MNNNEGLRTDDLMINGFRLLQDPSKFCFGTDSVLLADFAAGHIKRNSSVCELCCGNGAVSILILARREDVFLTGFELQTDVWELCEQNIELNGLSGSMKAFNADIKDIPMEHNGKYDAVVVNPPYSESGRGLQSTDENRRISRSETSARLKDIIACAGRLLKTKGRLIMVHRPDRFGEIVSGLREGGFELKSFRPVYSRADSKASMILFMATKGGGVWCDIEPPLIIYDDGGSYTDALLEIYHLRREE